MVSAGEKTGYLPGDINSKLRPYLQPIYDEMRYFVSYSDIQQLINQDIIEIVPFAYMRGRNFHNSFVIADECQNATEEQLFMLITRYCSGSKFVLTGDFTQSDLPVPKQGALEKISGYIGQIPNVEVVTLTTKDIVRDELVEDIIEAKNNYAQKHKDFGA
jgi:phosphate starvation-inducible protein PhoH and related proteins